MKAPAANYTKIGLDAWRAAVPLPLPLPPGPPGDWTCLYTLLGGGLAFHRESYQETAPVSLLRDVLELAGRPTSSDESRELLLVSPLPAGVDLVSLLQRAMRGRNGSEAVRLLGSLDDPRVDDLLLERTSDPDVSIRQEAVRALGLRGVGAASLQAWDGDIDGVRLLALVQQGVLPDELPAGELEALSGFVPSLDVAAGRAALADVDSLGEPLPHVLATVLARNPPVAAELAEAIAEHLARACDEAVWADAMAAAGEEGVELVLEALTAEDWRRRMGAAVVLGRLDEAGDRGIDALRKALGDDDGDVRREAALALASRGVDVPLESWSDSYGFLDRAGPLPWGAALTGGDVPIDLFALLVRRDSSEILARAALALAFAWPDLAAPALDAMARDEGFDVPLDARQAAAAGLLATGLAPRGPSPVSRVLLRGVATNGTTGPIAGLRSEDLAMLAARDGDWQVRYTSLGFLERTGEASRFDGLLAVLASADTDNDVRERAASMRASAFRTPGVAQALARLVTSSRIDSEARAQALEELAILDAGLGASLATALLDHTDRSMAVLAGRLAGRLATPEQVPHRLKRALGQLRAPDWIRREAAASLLGSLDPAFVEEGLLEELIEALEAAASDDDDSDVQRMAGWAAAELERRRA